jgi:uncharacterized membrane protein YgdD (TMEM256/DUF423 family)
MTRFFLMAAALFAGLSIGAGAFASHTLRDRLTERSLEIFETAARYQMYHALALLFVAVLLSRGNSLSLRVAGVAFMVGIVIFSGSLYALSVSDVKILGAVTPIGGVAFIVGWINVAIAAWNLKPAP